MIAVASNVLVDAALHYYRDYGWTVFPVNAATKKPYRGFKWKQFRQKRPTENDIIRWFSNRRYTGIAAICGAASDNLCALDLDSEKANTWWDTQHGDKILPAARSRRYKHLFMRSKPFPKQNREGLDLLSEGAYVVVAPSPGKEWLVPPNGQIPELDPLSLTGLEQFPIKKDKERLKRPNNNTPKHGLCSSVPQFLSSSVNSSEKLSSVNLDDDVRNEIERAIAGTLPEKQGEREALIFPFARWLRAIFPLDGTPIASLRLFVTEWHARALPAISTKPFEISWAAFARAFVRVRRPLWEVLFKFAIKDATADTENPPNDYEDETVRFLLRVCYQISQRMGHTPFGLSYRQAGQLTGLCHTQAGAYLDMFVVDGYLQIAEAYTFGSRRSTRYRYIGKVSGKEV